MSSYPLEGIGCLAKAKRILQYLLPYAADTAKPAQVLPTCRSSSASCSSLGELAHLKIMSISFFGTSQPVCHGVARTLFQRVSALAGEHAVRLQSNGGAHSSYVQRLVTRGQRLHRYSKQLRCALHPKARPIFCFVGPLCVVLAIVRLTFFAADALRLMQCAGSKAAAAAQYTPILSFMTGPFPSETLMRRYDFSTAPVKPYTQAAVWKDAHGSTLQVGFLETIFKSCVKSGSGSFLELG